MAIEHLLPTVMTGTVSHMQGMKPHGEMGLVGYAIVAGLALLLLPVLPFAAVLWLFTKLFGTDRDPTAR